MDDLLLGQMEKLRFSISTLESQRGVLGDEVVDLSLAGLRRQLNELEEQAEKLAVPAEERRMVTILFMDMVGSTSRAEKLDPEEWRQLIARFHGALAQAITAQHGSIAQYLGD